MFGFVRKKKYDAMIQSYAQVQHQHDQLVVDYRDLIDQNNGLLLKVATLKAELDEVSTMLHQFKYTKSKKEETK